MGRRLPLEASDCGIAFSADSRCGSRQSYERTRQPTELPDTPSVEQSNAVEIFLNGIAQFWPLWVLIGGFSSFGHSLWSGHGSASRGPALRRSTGWTGERSSAASPCFFDAGYHVVHVGRRGDYGADLIVRRNGKRTVVQAKSWTKNVGIKAVQEANAAPAVYECSDAMVVTNPYFTDAARSSRAQTASCCGIAIGW
jgi:restriction system protein